MKRYFTLLVVALLMVGTTEAAEPNKFLKSGNDRFSIKVEPFIGAYLMKSGNMKDIDPNPPSGIHFGIEFPSTQQRPWQQYLNNPTVGLGISYIDLGDKVMGQALAMYPYIMINGLRSEHFNLKVKIGSGLAGVNEHYYTTKDKPIPNKTFSTTINAYLTAGLNLEFPITRNFMINGELGFFHMSNGRMKEPNKGANVLYGGVGLVATINPTEEEERKAIEYPDLPYRWSINLTASSGIHAADQTDPKRFAIFLNSATL